MGIRPTILPWIVFAAGLSGGTGALFFQGSTVAEMHRDRDVVAFLVNAREKRLWDV